MNNRAGPFLKTTEIFVIKRLVVSASMLNLWGNKNSYLSISDWESLQNDFII